MLLNIHYVGEHLLLGTLGKTFIFLAFFAALLSAAFYLLAEIKQNKRFGKIGRYAYLFHFLSVVTVSIIFFYLLFSQYYEYEYVWKHTASYLPTEFIVSAFWAGQEGSFLLWILIQAVLGTILVFTAKKFENRVMTVFAAGQFLLTSMILGVKTFGVLLGQSPFALLREKAGEAEMEFFSNPNYLSQIVDGNGINPLLENYWMVIHPPALFLGYAAAIIPFAYAIASLWKKDYQSWLKPAFPWTIFGVISLGVGILLGGAWAYESLTFGGFWAWDPVENASLIPWLILLAGMHMMILNKKKNHSYGMSYVLIIFGYLLVVYASYLTRSGVLGETSAHAFGNNGLSTQMIVIMLAGLLVSLFLYLKNFSKFPVSNQDEFLSREFWMYLGAVVLILSSFQIFISTSIPVFNKVFGAEIAPPLEREAFYNRWQLPFALLVMVLTSVSLVLKYGKNDFQSFAKRYGFAFGAAIILFAAEIFVFEVEGFSYLFFLFTINLALTSSTDYLLRNKINQYNLSNSLSHLGFGIFMMGVLVAFSTSEVITSNKSRYDLGDQVANKENQILMRDEAKQLGEYLVKYRSFRQEGNHLFYGLDFYKSDAEGKVTKDFFVEPSINVNRRMGNVYDPDTYHSFKKDVFTYITYADINADISNDRFKELLKKEIAVGDTVITGEIPVVLEDVRVENPSQNLDVNNVTIIAQLRLLADSVTDSASFELAYKIENGHVNRGEKYFADSQLRFRFAAISTKSKGIVLGIDKKDMEFIVIKSTIFPYISIMWIGVLVSMLGLFISLYRNTILIRKQSPF